MNSFAVGSVTRLCRSRCIYTVLSSRCHERALILALQISESFCETGSIDSFQKAPFLTSLFTSDRMCDTDKKIQNYSQYRERNDARHLCYSCAANVR